MMLRTHIAFASAGALFLLPYVEHKLVFFPMVLFSTLLPDVDVPSSYMGRRWFFRPLQWFVKHRGLIHSFTLCLLISALLAFYVPVLALPFFLGYTLHLFGDSITVEGIRPFWPMKKEVASHMRTDGKVEGILFYVLVFANFIFFLRLFI